MECLGSTRVAVNSKSISSGTQNGTTNTNGILATSGTREVLCALCEGYLVLVYKRSGGVGFKVLNPANMNVVANTEVSITYFYRG